MSSKSKLVIFAGYLLLAVIWLYGLEPRTWLFLIASVLVAPALLFRNRSVRNKKPAPSQVVYLPKNKFLCALAISIGALGLYWALGYFGGRGFTPVIHDEYAYLFQAKTFARGRLYYPAHQFSQFFDAFHILTEKLYASKYPPGHALLLIPGVWLGIPILMPLLLSAGSLILFYLLVKKIRNENFALFSVSLFAICPLQLDSAASYQSHSTTLFFLLLCVCTLMKSSEHDSWVYYLTSGLSMGLAFATRPLTTLAVVMPFVAYYLFRALRNTRNNRECQDLKGLFLLGISFLSIVVMFLAYNVGLTGSPLKFPWIEYTQRYMPADSLGFGPYEELKWESVSPRKVEFYRSYVQELRKGYNVGNALKQLFGKRIRNSLRMVEYSIGLVPFLPLAFVVPMCVHEKLMLGSIVSLFSAYFFYYGGLERYHFEVFPFLIYFVVKGTCVFLELIAQTNWNWWVRSFLAWHLGWGVLFLISFKIPQDFYFKRKFTLYHASFRDLIDKSGLERKVIFVRYQPDHNFQFDLINNDPDLHETTNVFALDLGKENQKLLKYYRDRCFFIFDEKEWKLEKLSLIGPEVAHPFLTDNLRHQEK